MTEYCVCCGREIPEGRQVCPICERKADGQKRNETEMKLIIAEKKREVAKRERYNPSKANGVKHQALFQMVAIWIFRLVAARNQSDGGHG